LAQAYEQAYNLLQIFCEIEMTVNMLIQIDKLVQLLESPVFTYLRMQLLEPERHPNLYKCMYGLLMLLPQSSAFAALKNRLNSVSAIGYLHIGTRGAAPSTPSSVSTFERQNRLKSREEGGIKWTELLEKFRATQEKVRRGQQRALIKSHGLEDPQESPPGPARREGRASLGVPNPTPANPERPTGRFSPAAGAQRGNQQGPVASGSGHTKGKSSLGNLGRFTGGVARGVTGAAKGKK
jgi:vacuole morphology and inheritance protein 14